MTALLFALACAPGTDEEDETAATEECGDPDGDGTDTGNIPNVLGTWSITFATEYWKDICTLADFDENSEDWLNSLKLEGSVPYGIVGTFTDNPDETFRAVMDPGGGFSMTGIHARSDADLYAHFGGLVYTDADNGRDRIDGTATLGVDQDRDATVDCYARGSWNALKGGK